MKGYCTVYESLKVTLKDVFFCWYFTFFSLQAEKKNLCPDSFCIRAHGSVIESEQSCHHGGWPLYGLQWGSYIYCMTQTLPLSSSPDCFFWSVSLSFLGLLKCQYQDVYKPEEYFPTTENFSPFKIHPTALEIYAWGYMILFIFQQFYWNTEKNNTPSINMGQRREVR